MTNPAPIEEDEGQIQESLVQTFRDNVQFVRDYRGFSQSEFARRLGRSPGYVCDIEHGRRSPNLTTVALFAKALGIEASLLLSEDVSLLVDTALASEPE